MNQETQEHLKNTKTQAETTLKVLRENLDWVVRNILNTESLIRSSQETIDKHKLLIDQSTLKIEAYGKLEESLVDQIKYQENILDCIKESQRS